MIPSPKFLLFNGKICEGNGLSRKKISGASLSVSHYVFQIIVPKTLFCRGMLVAEFESRSKHYPSTTIAAPRVFSATH